MKKKRLDTDAQKKLINEVDKVAKKFDENGQTICVLHSTDDFRGYSFGGDLYELARTLIVFLHKGFIADTRQELKDKNITFDEKFLFCVMYAIRENMNHYPMFKLFFTKFVNNEICTNAKQPSVADLIGGLSELLAFLSSQCGDDSKTATDNDKKHCKRKPKQKQD